MGLTKPKKIVQSGVSLPTLSNPATAADIMKDKQAINQSGAVLTGNHVCKTLLELLPDMSNPATAEQILSGYQGVNDKGELVTGTLEAVNNINPVASTHSGYATWGSGSCNLTITPSENDQYIIVLYGFKSDESPECGVYFYDNGTLTRLDGLAYLTSVSFSGTSCTVNVGNNIPGFFYTYFYVIAL